MISKGLGWPVSILPLGKNLRGQNPSPHPRWWWWSFATSALKSANAPEVLWVAFTINGCFLVPLIGGRYHIIPQLAVYTTYILPIGWLYGTYHLLREPGNSIDTRVIYFITTPKFMHPIFFGGRAPENHPILKTACLIPSKMGHLMTPVSKLVAPWWNLDPLLYRYLSYIFLGIIDIISEKN